MWPKIKFGTHENKSLPVIALHDPDWLFWAAERGMLNRVARAGEVLKAELAA